MYIYNNYKKIVIKTIKKYKNSHGDVNLDN